MSRRLLFITFGLVVALSPFLWEKYQTRNVSFILPTTSDYEWSRKATIKRLSILIHQYPRAQTYKVSWDGGDYSRPNSSNRNQLTYFPKEKRLDCSAEYIGDAVGAGFTTNNVGIEDIDLAAKNGWSSQQLNEQLYWKRKNRINKKRARISRPLFAFVRTRLAVSLDNIAETKR